ncbi:MAG: type 4a pilus biogenesis protein PilO [Bacillota bacterium]
MTWWNNLSTREQRLIIGAVALILVTGYYFQLYQPQVKEITATEQELEQKLNQLKRSKQLLQQKEELNKKYHLLKKKLDNQEYIFLKPNQKSQLILDLNQITDEMKVELVTTQPQDAVKQEQYIQHPLLVTLLSDYNNLLRFFTELQKLDYIIQVAEVKITGELIEQNRIKTKLKLISYTVTESSGD